MDFDRTVYYVDIDSREHYYITERKFEDVVYESAEEITSPRGVMPIFFVDDMGDGTYEFCRWNCSKRKLIEKYENEKYARDAMLLAIYGLDWNDSEQSLHTFFTYEDAVAYIADCLDVPYNVAESIIHHGDCIVKIETQKWEDEIRKVLERFLKGKLKSKNFVAKYHEARFGKYILGRKVVFSDRNLLKQVENSL